MSSKIIFYEETERLKIDITISCLTCIFEIILRLFLFLIGFFYSSFGLISLIIIIGIATGKLPNDRDFYLPLAGIIGLLFFSVGLFVIIQSISIIRYVLLRRTRTSLEITCKTFKLSWSQLQLHKIIDYQLEDKIKSIIKVIPNTDKSKLTQSYNEGKYNISHNCLMKIDIKEYRFGKNYRFGNFCGLSSRDAHLLSQRINSFLNRVR